ncbi:MAG: ornithine carbamoyltransferase [Planctomycetota bacterium]|nr:ornithine carbamoyltransferase [Planctomycetota bacterium]
MSAICKHLISLDELSPDGLKQVLDLADRQKAAPRAHREAAPLRGKVAGLFFEKPSLRTRLSFEAGMLELGGHCIYMGPESGKLGVREPLKDTARVAARYLDALIVRVMKHESIEELARHSSVPVINALSDESHPCQALADLQTIREKLGRIQGVRVAFVGDGNNVARSLARGLSKLGGKLTLSAPEGFRFSEAFVKSLHDPGCVSLEADPRKAVAGADIVYTDVWTSMGQEEEAQRRLRAFAGYQVNLDLLALAPKALLMHDLPAHRGEEITDEAIDAPQSVIYDQAENRLHAQRALLTLMLG